jgi:2,3,4,5-tetrahydropyridine-2-carboxylate N-succinyltransferase
MSQQLQNIIDAAWEDRANISVNSGTAEVRDAVEHVIHELDNGRLRVATREAVGQWTTHQWIKKAVLLSFRLRDNEIMQAGQLGFYDKVQTKFSDMSAEEMRLRHSRCAASRRSARQLHRKGHYSDAQLCEHRRLCGRWHDGRHLGRGRVLRTDRQKRTPESGGVGIGGVLEPLQANPTIIEDNCFIGARSEVVEGRDRRRKFGALDGRIHRPEHPRSTTAPPVK